MPSADRAFDEFLFLYGESSLRIFANTMKKELEDQIIVWATRTQVCCKNPDGSFEIIPMTKVMQFYEVEFMPFYDMGKPSYLNCMAISKIMGISPKSRIIPIVELVKHLIKNSNDHVLMDVFREDIDQYFKNVHVEYMDDEDLISPYHCLTSEFFIIKCYKHNYEIEIQILSGLDVVVKNINLADYHRLLILFGVNIFSDYE